MQITSQRISQRYIHSVAQLMICSASPDCSRKSQVLITDCACAASLQQKEFRTPMLVAVEFVFVLFSQHAGVLWAFHAVGLPSGKSMPSPPPGLQSIPMQCHVVKCCPHDFMQWHSIIVTQQTLHALYPCCFSKTVCTCCKQCFSSQPLSPHLLLNHAGEDGTACPQQPT